MVDLASAVNVFSARSRTIVVSTEHSIQSGELRIRDIKESTIAADHADVDDIYVRQVNLIFTVGGWK